MIVSGRGGQVDVSLRDVMLSQLNYRASAYLNDGVEPQRYPNGAHSYYVPAQLFPTGRRLSGAVHHPRRVLAALRCRGGHRPGGRRWPSAPPTATRCSRVVAAALARDTALGWEARLRPLGIPAAAVRTLPEALEATPEVVVPAGDYRLVRGSIRVVGYTPDYGAPPLLGEHVARAEVQSS